MAKSVLLKLHPHVITTITTSYWSYSKYIANNHDILWLLGAITVALLWFMDILLRVNHATRILLWWDSFNERTSFIKIAILLRHQRCVVLVIFVLISICSEEDILYLEHKAYPVFFLKFKLLVMIPP